MATTALHCRHCFVSFEKYQMAELWIVWQASGFCSSLTWCFFCQSGATGWVSFYSSVLCVCVMLQDDICVSCRCSRGWTPADQAATSVHEWWRQWEWDWHRGWVRGCQEGEVVVLRAPSACQCSHCKKQCFIPPILAVVVLYSSSLGCSTLFLQSWL